MLVAVVTGARWAHAHDAPAAAPAHAYDNPRSVRFRRSQGPRGGLPGEMRVDSPEWRAYSAAGWKPGASAEVAVGASCIAWAGTLGQQLLRQWEIEQPVHAFVALLEPLVGAAANPVRATVPGRFPSVRRDLAFFVPRTVTHAQVERTLAGIAGGTLRAIELFDVYSMARHAAGHEKPRVRIAVPARGAHASRSMRSRNSRLAWWRPSRRTAAVD